MPGSAHRKRHNRVGWILFGKGYKAATIRGIQILHVVSLAKRVEHGSLRIVSHSGCASFMAGETRRSQGVLDNQSRFSCMQDLLCLHLHVFPEREIVLSELEVNNGNWNPIGVSSRRIDRYAVIRPGQDLSEAAHLKKSRLQVADLLLKFRSEAGEMLGVVRIPESGKLVLVLKATGICLHRAIHIESWNVSVI